VFWCVVTNVSGESAAIHFLLKMEAAGSSETLLTTYQTTRFHNSERRITNFRSEVTHTHLMGDGMLHKAVFCVNALMSDVIILRIKRGVSKRWVAKSSGLGEGFLSKHVHSVD